MDHEVRKLINEAISELKSGHPADALLVLERAIDPKFGSQSWARAKYREHMEQQNLLAAA